MATLEDVKAQIRFHLSELGRRNQHHEFERLCFDFARERIASNLLPATGPVAAGGDQGRDFETFRTYLAASPLAERAFVARASADVLVFTCSTQQSRLADKVRGDVRKVMGGGVRPATVYHFTTADVPTALRHRLQRWARDEHDVALEVIDLQALGEHLADRDLFWIARQHLRIPAEIYPPPAGAADEHAWYHEARARWAERDAAAANLADVEELRSAIRHATFDEASRGDVPLWRDRLEQVRGAHPGTRIARRAAYEIVVASLRGLGSLRGLEPEVRAYFAGVPGLADPADLEDATAFLLYVVGAHQRGLVDVLPLEIREWRDAVRRQLADALREQGAGLGAATACALLETAGMAAVVPDPTGAEALDPRRALAHWERLLALAPWAPLYPLTHFARRVSETAHLFGDAPGFAAMTDRLDELVAARHGDFAAADQARNRAVTFAREGRPLRAIQELHKAKVRWYAAETLHGAVLAMMQISEWYRALGLTFAAKQYALAAAAAAIRAEPQGATPAGAHARTRALAPRATTLAAAADYTQGAWVGCLGLVDAVLRRHGLLSPSAGDDARDEDVADACAFAAAICVAAERLGAEVAPAVATFVGGWGVDAWLDEVGPSIRDAFGPDADGAWAAATDGLGGRPFGDAARWRTAEWSALGVRWQLRFVNDLDTVPHAEGFAALLQVIAADLAGTDLVVLPTDVRVEVAVRAAGPGERPTVRAEPIPSNDGRDWRLTLVTNDGTSGAAPTERERDRVRVDALAATFQMLREACLAPSTTFAAAMDALFRRGLSAKTFIYRDYHALYRDVVDEARFLPALRRAELPPGAARPFTTAASPGLGWEDGPGTGYDPVEERRVIARRYERAVVPVRHTLARLRQSPAFAGAVAELRAEGWRDWHVLMGVASAAINERARRALGAGATPQALQRELGRLRDLPEADDAPGPPAGLFIAEHLRRLMYANMLVALHAHGLESHQRTPDFPALRRVFETRYGYGDDVEHDASVLPGRDGAD